ncbi:hypothetical protein T484DRAFT_1777319, partial [Baffinella frigidus]
LRLLQELRRLQEVIASFRKGAVTRGLQEVGNKHVVGNKHMVLVEGPSKRSTAEKPQLTGRSDNNKMCVFDALPVPDGLGGMRIPGPGDWVSGTVMSAGAATLHIAPELLQRAP